MTGEQLLFQPWLITLFLGLIFFLFLYWYSTRNADYWKKRGIPYVKPVLPFFGSTFPLLFKPFHKIELEHYQILGPFYGHFEGSRPALSIADPKLIRDVLVKDFPSFANRRDVLSGNAIVDSVLPALRGEDWKRVRSIVSPTFTTGKIKRMVNIIKDCSETLMQNFKNITKSGKTLDAKEFYGAFTLDVIASSAFSTKLDSHNDPKNKFVQVAKLGFSTNFSLRVALYQLFPKLMQALKIPFISSKPTNFFKDLTLQMIEQRNTTGQTRNDFLQLLMDTAKETNQEQKLEAASDKDDITSNYGQDESTHLVTKNVANKNLSLNELVAQCVIFFLAGYDTTATVLSNASYLLALHPEIQSKVYEEIREVLDTHKGELTYEALREMKYLDNIISETLRIYPPVVRLERLTTSDCKLGDTGLTVPKGMIITIPNHALQNDPKYFPEPEKFDPNRAEERGKRDPYVYLPFGAGPRNCVGMRFALMEVKVCLAYVIANFKFQRCQETKVPLEFHMGPGLLLAKHMVLKLEERTDKIPLK